MTRVTCCITVNKRISSYLYCNKSGHYNSIVTKFKTGHIFKIKLNIFSCKRETIFTHAFDSI